MCANAPLPCACRHMAEAKAKGGVRVFWVKCWHASWNPNTDFSFKSNKVASMSELFVCFLKLWDEPCLKNGPHPQMLWCTEFDDTDRRKIWDNGETPIRAGAAYVFEFIQKK